MPRPRTYSKVDLIHAAMRCFWSRGYEAVSMDLLVQETGVSRHGIYADVGGKHDLYLQSFSAYRDAIVVPALAPMEASDAAFCEIENYFDVQISLAEKVGLPGPGCFFANAMTETAPHDPSIATLVCEHNNRLQSGFRNCLKNSEPTISAQDVSRLSAVLLVSAQGLWSMSRVSHSAKPLRDHAKTLLKMIEGALKHDC